MRNRKAPPPPPPYNPDYDLIGLLEEPERVPLPPPVEGATYYPAGQHGFDNEVLLTVIGLLIMFAGGVLVGRALF